LAILRILKNGLMNGLQVTWELAKAIVPFYFLITFVKHTPALDWISKVCEPFMSYLGLPGEASLPLVLGNALNLYPALGAIEALSMNGKQITIIAVMLLFSHSLFLELAVTKKAGVGVTPVLFLRLLMAIFAGFALNAVL